MQKHDREGRMFIAMHDVRGALVSASASITTGTATSLIAGDSDYFLDMIEATFANNSNASATIALTNDGTTIRTFQIPAGSTIQLRFDSPLRQNTKALPWLADMEDITGTTISVDARFIKSPQ